MNKIREKQENIQLLEAECKDRGIFEDKNEENLALKNRVAHKKKEIEEYEKIIWQLEQKISKKVASADKIQCEINKILIQLDLTNLKNCDSSEMMKYSIENLIENTQEDLKKLQIANENFRQNLSDYKKGNFHKPRGLKNTQKRSKMGKIYSKNVKKCQRMFKSVKKCQRMFKSVKRLLKY